MQQWTGVLAYTDRPTRTGTILVTPERLLTRPLPLPLFENYVGEEPDRDRPIGSVTTLSIHGDEVRAEGTIRDGILTPGQPMAVGIDVIPEDTDISDFAQVLYRRWRIAAATALTDPGRDSAWPGAVIRLKEEQPR